MSEMMQTDFDYAALPVDAALTARAAAERIKLRLKRTVEDIIEIGRELTAVKDQLPHGQFLPWVAAEFEMSQWTANQFMNAADRFGDKLEIITNLKPTILYSLAAPSTPESVVTQAIEHVESGEKVTISDVKKWKHRAEEFRQESNERRKKIRELEQQVGLLQSHTTLEPQKIEVPPDDYDELKKSQQELIARLDALKNQQQQIVQKQVTEKLKEREAELASIDRKVKDAEANLSGLQEQLDRYSYQQRELKVHLDTIEKARTGLAILAANLEGFDTVIDSENELRRWRALSQMMRHGADAIDFFTGDARPSATALRLV